MPKQQTVDAKKNAPWRFEIRRLEMPSELRSQRQALEQLWQQGLGGHELLARQAELVDAFVVAKFEDSPAVRQTAGEIALIALGGYGRRELYPFSDIDLLLLHDRKAAESMREIAEAVLYPLWDAGFEVGHSVRSIEDAVQFAGADFVFQVSLLDARLLAGSDSLHKKLLAEYQRKVVDGGRSKFVRTMNAMRAERRQKHGSHAYLLEPHVKEGRGGLRDIQSMLWLAKAVFGLSGLAALEDAGMLTAEERHSLAESWDMLSQIRNWLHWLSQRRNDRLFFEHQEKMAAAFGYQDQNGMRAVEHFMRHVYAHLQVIAVTTDLFFEQVHENLELSGKVGREQELEQGIVVRSGSIRLTVAETGLARQPHLLMRIFLQASRSGLPIHHRSRQTIARSLHLADDSFRTSKRTAKSFVGLLMGSNPRAALEAMLETGLLTAYLPEFAKVESLAQHDLYHICTVDRHLLQTVAELKQMEWTEPELMASLKSPSLLLLAGLLHDVGKGHHADHSLLGAELVEGIGLRMGLDSSERKQLTFLVRHHLFLPENALRRDLDDRNFIREAAKLIGDTDQLTMLYLLSIADSRATGPSAWSEWKASLLVELFLKVRACLEAGCSATAEADDRMGEEQGAAWLREQVLGLLRSHEETKMSTAETVLAAKLPADYLTSFTPEAVVRHLSLHRDWAVLLRQKVLLFPDQQPSAWSLLIMCSDRHGLLAKICGVLALHNLSVLAAKIFTWPDETVVDVLDVVPAADTTFGDQDWTELENDLNRAVNYRLDVGRQLRGKLEALGSSRMVQQLKTDVAISNSASDRHTVIEVYGGDRLGTLYQLTQILSDFRLSIHRARIATEVEQLIDVFYVTTEDHRKIEDAAVLAEIRQALLHVLQGSDQKA